MFPRLHIGGNSLSSYWLFNSLGLLVGLITAWRLGRQAGVPARHVLALALGAVLFGMVGAHLLYALANWETYHHRSPLAWLRFWRGRAFLGGPIGGLAFVMAYGKLFRLPGWKILDVLIPGLVIGHMFGRFGCCAGGCCHGAPTGSWFGVPNFRPDITPAEWYGQLLTPVQLYEAAGLLVLFYALLWLFRQRLFDGRVVLGYSLTYPVLRFGIEFLRGDVKRGFVFDGLLSTSQFVSLLVFGAALLALGVRLWQVRAQAQPERIDQAERTDAVPILAFTPSVQDCRSSRRAA